MMMMAYPTGYATYHRTVSGNKMKKNDRR